MKTALILAGAIALVLISMESPAFGSPAPPNEAIVSPMSDTLIDNKGLVRQKREHVEPGTFGTRCRSDSDCNSDDRMLGFGLGCRYGMEVVGGTYISCRSKCCVYVAPPRE